MKILKIFAAVLLMSATAQLQAQEAIKAAFNHFASNPKVKVTHSVSYDRSPTAQGTGKLRSMLEVYNFETKSKNRKLVDDILKAMYAEKDNPACYRIESYSASALQQPRAWDLLYGEEAQNKVEIGRNRVYSYTFVNIADQSPSAQGQYRTCCCIEWREWLGKIDGRLIITYARIPDLAQNAPMSYNATAVTDSMVIDTALFMIPRNTETVTVDGIFLNMENFTSELLQKGDPLAMFALLRKSFLEGQNEHRIVIAPLIYRLLKKAVSNGQLTNDERKILNKQLVNMHNHVFGNPGTDSTITDYLNLARKVLRTNETP